MAHSTSPSPRSFSFPAQLADDRSPLDVVIIGGGGHIGLPLGLMLAEAGLQVVCQDINAEVLETIAAGRMPFLEHGAQELLDRVLGRGLGLTTEPAVVARARYVIVAIGTPVDEYLNPKLRAVFELFESLRPHLDPAQTIVVRSTVYPHTCQKLAEFLGGEGWKVAYCPERIAQGFAIRELRELPQIVSGVTPEATESAAELFSRIAPQLVRIPLEAAELAKLFSNAWRYVQFAAANQFYMMATEFGVDYETVRSAMVQGYGRAAGLPTAGFAAGPCLLKDTMQLAAFSNNNFPLGHSAMLVNEGLPNFIVQHLRLRHDLAGKRIGILGMAFKADVDDNRDSLSYKLGKILRFHGAEVIYSDEFVSDPTFVSRDELLARAEVVIVGVPHSAYRDLAVPPGVEVIDTWGVLATPSPAMISG